MKFKIGLVLAGLAVLVGLNPAHSAPEKKSISVGVLPTPEFLPVFVADREGFLAKEGLTATNPTFQAGPGVLQALVSGALDIAATGAEGVLTAVNIGRPVKAIWELNNFMTFRIVAQKNIKSWSDMKGKSVAISSPGSQTDEILRWVAKKQGLDPDRDLTIVATGSPAARLAALTSGATNAGVLTEPTGSRAVEEGYTLLTRVADYMPKWPSEVLYCSESFIKKNPQTIKAYLRAISAADRYIPGHKDEVVKILMDDMKLSKLDAEQAFTTFKDTYSPVGDFSMPGWDFVQTLMLSSGALKAKLPYDKVIDPTFVDWAKATLK